MNATDFQAALEIIFVGKEADVAKAASVYALNQPNGNNETKAYTDYYWAGTHVLGDFGFSCPSRRAARAFKKYAAEQPVYMYNFVHTPLAPPFGWAGVPGPNQHNTSGASHASEIEFVFQAYPDCFGPNGAFAGEDGCEVYVVLDAAEQLLAETMAGYWTNFARTSDPNGPTHGGGATAHTPLTINWPPYTAAAEESITLDVGMLAVEGQRNDAQCDFIDTIKV